MAPGLWWLLGENLGWSMPARVYVTGRVEIECDGRLVRQQQFPGRQGRLLFAYLICHRQRPMTREELAEALWPGELPDAWEGALHALISKLRTLLKGLGEPNVITLTSAFGTYLLGIEGEVWIDREAAAEAIDDAEGRLRADDRQGAWAPSNIAAITARQPFLAGEEGEWIRLERARLTGILVRALDCLIDIWLANGESALALEAARENVALEPFRETSYQRLIRVHESVGNRAEALRVYESCRVLLATELGVDPSLETQALYLRLLGSP
jgi:SARP family transcriptional regulator, regulator of embCAB operon